MKTKMRPLKQLVSILTCIVLVFSVIPMAAFAAESGVTGTLSYTECSTDWKQQPSLVVVCTSVCK